MLEVIILAAGQGSRMQSSLPKVLHTLAGQPLVAHVLQTARALDAQRIHVVVGHGAEAVEATVSAPDVQCHLQAEQLGTGHAVQQAIFCKVKDVRPAWAGPRLSRDLKF